MQRRETLKAGLASLGALARWSAGFIPVTASASCVSRLRIKLVAALRSIDNAACAATATRLEASLHHEDGRLHLRGAGLTTSDTAVFANTLRSLTAAETSKLVSLSLSDNKDVGNIGAVHLARALPKNLPERGLVGCKIGETEGTALFEWARKSTHLRMLCVEGNNFPRELVTRFRALPRTRPHLNVYV
ncbi:MAG: hypothetical protein ACI9DC_003248 [Gammaproteobacteria bacterium]|jgi:hypothetical protein